MDLLQLLATHGLKVLGIIQNKFMSKSVIIVLTLTLIFNGFVSSNQASAGIFDCVKARKWAAAKSLKTSYLMDPAKKSDTDWFNSYIFARIYTGYPGCFNKSDVDVMRQYVQYINEYCVRNPKWNYACFFSKGYGKLADLVYSNYK